MTGRDGRCLWPLCSNKEIVLYFINYYDQWQGQFHCAQNEQSISWDMSELSSSRSTISPFLSIDLSIYLPFALAQSILVIDSKHGLSSSWHDALMSNPADRASSLTIHTRNKCSEERKAPSELKDISVGRTDGRTDKGKVICRRGHALFEYFSQLRYLWNYSQY